MYEAYDDPYCYPGTAVVKNKLGLTEPEALEAFETEITTARAAEPLPRGRLGVAHYRAGHRLEFSRLDPDAILAAMIASYHDETDPLRAVLFELIES